MKSEALVQKKAETIRQLLENPAVKKQIQLAIPKHLTIDRLLRTTMTAIRSNPTLLDCTQKSLLACVMGMAQLGLEPEPFLGQAYLVPFRNKGVLEATLIPGYRGYIALARRSGELQSLTAQVVYENDHFILKYGTEEKLEHIPADGNRGNPKGAYVIFRYKDGSYSFDYMSKDDIEKIRARSKAKDHGPWVTDWDEMAKKTVIRRHIKLAPLSVEIQKMAHLEDRAITGQSQFDVIFPELPELPDNKEEEKNFDDLIKDKDTTYLETFLKETAEANSVTVEQLKEEASKEFDAFWQIFEKWRKQKKLLEDKEEKKKKGKDEKREEMSKEEAKDKPKDDTKEEAPKDESKEEQPSTKEDTLDNDKTDPVWAQYDNLVASCPEYVKKAMEKLKLKEVKHAGEAKALVRKTNELIDLDIQAGQTLSAS